MPKRSYNDYSYNPSQSSSSSSSGYRRVRPRTAGYVRPSGQLAVALPRAPAGLRRATDFRSRYSRPRYVGVRRTYSRPWTFRDRVRAATLPDLGLHTNQKTVYGYVTSSGGQRASYLMDCMSVGFFVTLGVLTPATSEKAKIRSALTQTTFSNGTNGPIRMSTYECICRKNARQTPAVLLAKSGVVQTYPYVDPTSSTDFRRFYKIIRRKREFIQAGQQVEVETKAWYPSPRPITGDVEENGTDFNATVGTRIVLCYFEGPPCEDTGTSVLSVGVPGIKVNYVTLYKCTYYLMEDNDPVNSTTDGAPVGGNYAIYTDVVKATETTDGP